MSDIFEALEAEFHKLQGAWHIQIFEDQVKLIITSIASNGFNTHIFLQFTFNSQGIIRLKPLIENTLTLSTKVAAIRHQDQVVQKSCSGTQDQLRKCNVLGLTFPPEALMSIQTDPDLQEIESLIKFSIELIID